MNSTWNILNTSTVQPLQTDFKPRVNRVCMAYWKTKKIRHNLTGCADLKHWRDIMKTKCIKNSTWQFRSEKHIENKNREQNQ